MQNIDRILPNPIENPEGVSNNGYNANLRALRHSRPRLRYATDAIDHFIQPLLDSCGHYGARVGGIPCQYLIEVGESPPRIGGFHARRYLAKTALISAADALSPASIEAIAASMISSSSRVAT